MAGSYDHVTKSNGALRKPQDLLDMLDCSSGDVYEAIEEMYGMIWYLGWVIAMDQSGNQADPALYVEAAREEYKTGLVESPTKRFQE